MKETVLITGATAGIGLETARIFSKNGYRLILTGRRADRLAKIKKELEENDKTEVMILAFDIRENSEVEKALGQLPEGWQDIDLLVNNAGLAVGLNHINEGVLDDWERMIDTNVKGLLYVTRVVSPLMVKRGKGHIINVGSIAGKETYENGNVYCASKHAVDALSRGMRLDLLKHNIKVSNIAPGLVDTEFSIVRFKGDNEKAEAPYKGMKPLRGEDVAGVIYFCASLPEHVNINDVVIMPTAQANATTVSRKI